MLILQVHIHVKPECVEAFRIATIENARNSAQEPGVARFDFIQHSDDPNRFSLWEVYWSQEGAAAHKLMPHYAKWVEATQDMFAEPRTRTWYKSVFPADESW
jgi:autoinducer 2-degrading protein